MNLQERFTDFITRNSLFTTAQGLLIAVSGGIDSVVLCEMCYKAGYKFTIAHCNFNLRGEESQRDEVFVRSLSEKYKVEVLVNKFETKKYAEVNNISIQEAARELRYNWFYELVGNKFKNENSVENEANSTSTIHYILTAHHVDDNIETVLMNFFKGTGITGLRGILPKQGKIVRPLLFATKKEILAYAEQHKLSWVEDSSNKETKYTRNYFRHTIIPLVEKMYPEAAGNVAHNIDRFRDVEVLYQQAIDVHKKKLIEQKGTEFHIPVLKLLKSQPTKAIIYEIIKDLNFSSRQVDEVVKLLYSESGKYITSSTHRVLRNRKWLVLSPLNTLESSTIVIEKENDEIIYNDKRLKLRFIKSNNFSFSKDNFIAEIDSKELGFPLLLRRWKEGDYFYPLGMKKKKKLARFFIDLKLSKNEKEKVWVVESNKRIVWVIGYRIDDRFKITPHTKEVLQLTISNL